MYVITICMTRYTNFHAGMLNGRNNNDNNYNKYFLRCPININLGKIKFTLINIRHLKDIFYNYHY